MSDLTNLLTAGMPFGSIRIMESGLAMKTVRVKTYPKRRGKTPAHWARMDKKWRKRYGTKQEPCVYITQAGFFGECLLVHPSLMPAVRAATREHGL